MNTNTDKPLSWLLTMPAGRRRLLSVFYLALVMVLSLLPSDSFRKVPRLFAHMDKVVHFLMYGGMAVMLCWAFPRRDRKQLPYYAAIILFCTLYGLFMEILQEVMAILGRSFSWYDEAVNISGAIVLTIVWKIFSGKLQINNLESAHSDKSL